MKKIKKFSLFESKIDGKIITKFNNYSSLDEEKKKLKQLRDEAEERRKELQDEEKEFNKENLELYGPTPEEIPSKDLPDVTLKTFRDKEVQKLYNEYRENLDELNKLHHDNGHKVRYRFAEPSSQIKADKSPVTPKEMGQLLKDVKSVLKDHQKKFEDAKHYAKYIADEWFDEYEHTLWDIVASPHGLGAMRNAYRNNKDLYGVFMDFYKEYGIENDPYARTLTKQEIDKIKNARGKTKIGKLPFEDEIKGLAKDFYYLFWENGKSCRMDSDLEREEAFEKAKRDGCNYFRWKGEWYHTETDMPIGQELKAYRNKNFPHNVVVDYFNMGQGAAGGGMGHIQAWSLDDPKYQINAMPSNAENIESVILGPSPEEIYKFSKGEKIDTAMYNQKVDELNNLEKESIVIRMNDKEYNHFKETAGDWAGKAITDVNAALVGGTNKNYNVLFSNCSHHTLKGVLDMGNGGEILKQLKLTTNTIPYTAYGTIKRAYEGRYEERKDGIRLIKLKKENLENVPSQYGKAEYVLENAKSVVGNGWTIILQKTIYAQLEKIEELAKSSGNPDYKRVAEAIKAMKESSAKREGGNPNGKIIEPILWDRTFKQGGSTDKALQAILKVMENNSYNPVNLE